MPLQPDTAAKIAFQHGVPWEEAYGYAQAIKTGNIIYVSGQLSHDDTGAFVGGAPLDDAGKVTDFSMMELQMRTTYLNIGKILGQAGADWSNVVEETLFVLDVPAAFAVARKVRSEFYGEESPRVASNLIGVSALAMPQQLIEVALRADLTAS